MIKIIAVHPDVMSSPEGIREYLKDFGTGKGRWIPLIPADWKSIVSQNVKNNRTLGPVKKSELRDKITNRKFNDRYLRLEQNASSGDWYEVIGSLCKAGSFDAAIVKELKARADFFLEAHDFDPDCDLYSVCVSGFFSRDPEEMAIMVAPGLRFATELHVIDLYCRSCGTNSSSYGKFFRKMLDSCRQTSPSLTSITLHRRVPDDFNKSREETNYRSWVTRSLREGETLKIRYLRERPNGDRMHLRAVFTNNILITGHYGFGSGSSEAETTDLTLREHKDLLEIRSLYLSDNEMGFDLAEEIEITIEPKQ